MIYNILMIGGGQAAYQCSRYYEYAKKLANGFTRNGHNVVHVYDKDLARLAAPFKIKSLAKKHVNNTILQYAQDLRPHLVICKHANMISNETLVQLKEMGIRTAQINVDALFNKENLDVVKSKAPYFDATFLTTGGEIMIEAGQGKPAYYVPNIVDKAIDTGKAFEGSAPNDIFLAVGNLNADPNRLATVNALEKLKEKYTFAFYNSVNQGLWGRAYIDTLSSSKCGINLTRTDVKGHAATPEEIHLYSSDRLAQIVGNGSLAFTHEMFGIQELFSPEEMVFYSNYADLADLLDMHLKDDKLRRTKAEAGWTRAHRDYNSDRVAEFMADAMLNGGPTKEYPWPAR